MSLHDRIEFALRDAGFDLDEAFHIAELASIAIECPVCEPDGIYDTEGNGPYDCYACGKKAKIASTDAIRAYEIVHADGRVQFVPKDCADIAEICQQHGGTITPLIPLK